MANGEERDPRTWLLTLLIELYKIRHEQHATWHQCWWGKYVDPSLLLSGGCKLTVWPCNCVSLIFCPPASHSIVGPICSYLAFILLSYIWYIRVRVDFKVRKIKIWESFKNCGFKRFKKIIKCIKYIWFIYFFRLSYILKFWIRIFLFSWLLFLHIELYE